MEYNKILVVTDNHYLFREFKKIIADLKLDIKQFKFCCTSLSTELIGEGLERINIKKDFKKLIDSYNLIMSLHCKQIFPKNLVNSVKCINIHPGLNPYNRGWYPQVFSILNKLPIGATIHEMDEEIDHGKIIDQTEVKINSWETSLDVYNKVLKTELELIKKNLLSILNNNYKSFAPNKEGNYNGINDFEKLLEINITEEVKVIDFIDKLRALTHGDFKNAYFIEPKTGEKIYISIKLQRDE